MTQEREKENFLTSRFKLRVEDSLRQLRDDPEFGSMINDADTYGETGFSPNADTDIGIQAESIRAKYKGGQNWDNFVSACELVKAMKSIIKKE